MLASGSRTVFSGFGVGRFIHDEHTAVLQAWVLSNNRTFGFRVLGEANSSRIENRMPGADANPCLAFAAMPAAGMAWWISVGFRGRSG